MVALGNLDRYQQRSSDCIHAANNHTVSALVVRSELSFVLFRPSLAGLLPEDVCGGGPMIQLCGVLKKVKLISPNPQWQPAALII